MEHFDITGAFVYEAFVFDKKVYVKEMFTADGTINIEKHAAY